MFSFVCNKSLASSLPPSYTCTCSPNLSDYKRLSTLVKMSASSLTSSVASYGHSFAMTAAASELSPSAKLNELFSGMTQVLTL